MPKARKKVTLPPVPLGDIGPETAASLSGCMIEEFDPGKGRRKERMKRRYHVLEAMGDHRKAKWWTAQGLVLPKISIRQELAGLQYFEAWAETERSAEQNGVFVDSVPDYEMGRVRSVEAIERLSGISRYIPHGGQRVVDSVCLAQQIPDQFEWAMLKVSLDLMANGLGIWVK